METILKANSDFFVIEPQISRDRKLYGFERMPVIGWHIAHKGDVTAITPTGKVPDAVVELPGGCGFTMTPGMHFEDLEGAATYLEDIHEAEMTPALQAELGIED